MDFNYSQYVVDTYFRIAKTKDQHFADNINEYMFMYRKGDDLYFKNRNTRQYKTITFQLMKYYLKTKNYIIYEDGTFHYLNNKKNNTKKNEKKS